MSYILDALKKAEHQRDLGQVPGIGTEHEEVTTGVSRWVYFLLVVLVVNAGLLVYALWPEPRSQTAPLADRSGTKGSLATPQTLPAVKPSAVVPRTGPQATLPAKAAHQTPVQTRPTPAPTASNPPPVLPEVAKPVVVEPPRSPAGASRQQASLPTEATRQTPAAPPPAAPRPLPATVKPAVTEPPASPAGASRQQASAETTHQASAATAAAPATLRPLPPLPEVAKPAVTESPSSAGPEARAVQPAVTASAPAAATAKTSAAADRNNNLPVWPQVSGQLFREVNSSLNLDVHVYSERPQERFVLINMQKYNEGETLQEGPVVDEITLGGVILSFHGQRFRVQAQ